MGVQPSHVHYVGFTATPSDEALSLFGECDLWKSMIKWTPTYTFSLRDAVDQRLVLDVLDHYRTSTETETADRTTLILRDFHTARQEVVGWKVKGMIVVESRNAVVEYVRALRTNDESLCVYGFFSGRVDGRSEGEFNGFDERDAAEATKAACEKGDILVVCDKLDTGYDDPRLSRMYVCRKYSSPGKFVQVVNRINRINGDCPGKIAKVIDFENGKEEVSDWVEQYKGKSSCSIPYEARDLKRAKEL
jgi:type I site-specific restriction-modification system R (restriction) subunit